MPPKEKSARARRSSPPVSRRSRSSNRASTLLLGIGLGIIAASAALWFYHRFQRASFATLPVTSSRQAPTPALPRSTPEHVAPLPKITTEPEAPPFGISEDVFESGARLYSVRCAGCHGTPRHSAAALHPTALQLWKTNPAKGGTGVSNQRPAQIYRSIAEGQLAAGMPSYRGVLTTTQIWQLSLLLRSAGQDLPDPVLHLLDNSTP